MGTRVFAVNKAVHHKLANNNVSNTYTIAFFIERKHIGHPLFAKRGNLPICLHQVALANKPIIVSVGIGTAKNDIRAVHGGNIQDGFFLPNEHNSRKVESVFACRGIPGPESRSPKQLFVVKGKPRVVFTCSPYFAPYSAQGS